MSTIEAQNRTNFNTGKWVSAKIYSDNKKGCSVCGSKEWKREPLKGIDGHDFPVCAKCGADPDRLIIVASIIDEAGRKKQVKIRNTQEGKRINDRYDCIFTLRRVAQEIKQGIFHVGRYESTSSRDRFIFGSVVKEYLEFHQRRKARGELSPGGLRDKESLIRNHLLPEFHDSDIAIINDQRIKLFYQAFTDRLRTRDKATQELKTILLWAEDQKLISEVPEFPDLAPSDMVDPSHFLSRQEQERVIAAIKNPLYRNAIALLALYALRPCEVRSLKWSDIDRDKGIFYIRSHISNGEEIKGRKSQRNKVHVLPMVDDFMAVLESMDAPENPDSYVFQGSHGGAIGGNVLTLAWNEACELAGVKKVTLYQGTKHSTLSRLAQEKTDSQIRALTGHSGTRMLHRYAQSGLDDVRKMIGG
jgi:integrase